MERIFASVAAHLFYALTFLLLSGCISTRTASDPVKKYAPDELRSDFTVFRGVLENCHPGIYWFTPKEEMNRYFDQAFSFLNDSLNEPQFLNHLSYVANKIRCGHTVVRRSRGYSRYLDTATAKLFPLSVKVWPDSMAVTSNLLPHDTLLPKGTIITEINGRNVRQWTDTFFHYIASDGHSLNGKYQALSNTGSFAGYYRRLWGDADQFSIRYKDGNGIVKEATLPAFERSPRRKDKQKGTKTSVEKNRSRPMHPLRHLAIDTAHHTAIMTLNTFTRGNGLRRFFRKSFRTLYQSGIENLVLDVRANGGGDASLSILLTRYLSQQPFRIADSLYAVKKSSTYSRYIDRYFFYEWGMRFITKRMQGDLRHFRYFERHVFQPKKKFHFDGSVYLITGGNSFSATTVMLKMLQGGKNITVVGEETGGGRYGNSAWMLPQATLPRTGIRFTVPLFRMVMDKTAVTSGTGILPDVEIGATQESIRKNEDPKMIKVFELISQRRQAAAKETGY